jgi:predicted Abi (CAAX) family protease
MQTMAWQAVDDVLILVHGAQEPVDAEWDQLVEAARKYAASAGRLRSLVVTPGPGPNMSQRKRLNAVTDGQPIPAAVVTDSMVGRAIVTLVGLRNPAIRAFEPQRLDQALEYLGVPSQSQARIREAVQALKQRVGT